MKPIEDILEAYASYYQYSRGVGHSYVALNGVKHTGFARLVVANENQGRSLDVKSITWSDVDRIRGLTAPLVWDNEAIRLLCVAALNKINKLKQEIIVKTNDSSPA